MAKPHYELRKRMKEYGYKTGDLAERLERSCAYISQCLCGSGYWRSNEMYAIADMMDIPDSEIHIYFPRDGILDENIRESRQVSTKMEQACQQFAESLLDVMNEKGRGRR